MYLKDAGCGDVDWVHLTPVTVQWRNLAEHDKENSGSINGG